MDQPNERMFERLALAVVKLRMDGREIAGDPHDLAVLPSLRLCGLQALFGLVCQRLGLKYRHGRTVEFARPAPDLMPDRNHAASLIQQALGSIDRPDLEGPARVVALVLAEQA